MRASWDILVGRMVDRLWKVSIWGKITKIQGGPGMAQLNVATSEIGSLLLS